jgi:lipopolysaccharide/colanic/teichoic acid biosynthesis glycosyltransferase
MEVKRAGVVPCPTSNKRQARQDPSVATPHVLPIIGRFIRRTSLDEMPQQRNVIRGDIILLQTPVVLGTRGAE